MSRKFRILSLFLVSIIGLLYTACQDAAPTEATNDAAPLDLEEIIPGTWEAVSMLVEVKSAEGIVDSNYTFRINDGDWASVFSVSPPVTYFERNNKYRVEFRDRLDSVMSINRGIWNAMGDTLMMIEPDATYQFKVTEGKGLIFFREIRDWDGDGEADDDYLEVKRRVSIGTN